MPNIELEKYIESARAQHVPDEAIKSKLIKFGWSDHDIAEALAPKSYQEINLPPPPAPRFGMWIAFQYILLFITLYISATCLAGIMHQAVDNIIPDSLDKAGFSYQSSLNDTLMKGYIAGIIVAFPLFVWLFLTLKYQVQKKPAIRGLMSRKVLIYLTLVVTFLIMIGHLIMTIFQFLNGTTTARSIAHLMVTIIVAGTIFLYLLVEVHEDREVRE